MLRRACRDVHVLTHACRDVCAEMAYRVVHAGGCACLAIGHWRYEIKPLNWFEFLWGVCRSLGELIEGVCCWTTQV